MRKRLVTGLFGLLGVAGAAGLVGGGGITSAGEMKDASYAVKVDVPPAAVGKHAIVKLHLKPGQGYHVNKEFPVGVTLVSSAGVKTDKPKLGKADAARFDETGVDFDLDLVAAAPGKQVVAADMKFAVCSATACEPKREKVSFTLEVK